MPADALAHNCHRVIAPLTAEFGGRCVIEPRRRGCVKYRQRSPTECSFLKPRRNPALTPQIHCGGSKEFIVSAARMPPVFLAMETSWVRDGFAWPRYSAISRALSPDWSKAVATVLRKL